MKTTRTVGHIPVQKELVIYGQVNYELLCMIIILMLYRLMGRI